MRLYDRDTVIAALRRLWFAPRHEITGARRPIKRGTLKSILELLEGSEEDFEKAVR
ncbi:MAG TPA: hypothetical protein VF157_09690 [Chloroflexota bacterium]